MGDIKMEVYTSMITKMVKIEEPLFILTMTEDEAKELLSVVGALAPYSKGNPKGPTVTSAIFKNLTSLFDARGWGHGSRRYVRMDGIIPTWA